MQRNAASAAEEGGKWLSNDLLVSRAKKRHELGALTAIEVRIGQSGQGVGAPVGGGQALSFMPGDGRVRRTPAVGDGFGSASASEDCLQQRQPVGSDGERVPGAAVFTQPKQARTHLVGGRPLVQVTKGTPSGEQGATACIGSSNYPADEAGKVINARQLAKVAGEKKPQTAVTTSASTGPRTPARAPKQNAQWSRPSWRPASLNAASCPKAAPTWMTAALTRRPVP